MEMKKITERQTDRQSQRKTHSPRCAFVKEALQNVYPGRNPAYNHVQSVSPIKQSTRALHVLLSKTAVLTAHTKQTLPPPLVPSSAEQKRCDPAAQEINTTGFQRHCVPCGISRKTRHILVATLL